MNEKELLKRFVVWASGISTLNNQYVLSTKEYDALRELQRSAMTLLKEQKKPEALAAPTKVTQHVTNGEMWRGYKIADVIRASNHLKNWPGRKLFFHTDGTITVDFDRFGGGWLDYFEISCRDHGVLRRPDECDYYTAKAT
jgi:hypothetical protein